MGPKFLVPVETFYSGPSMPQSQNKTISLKEPTAKAESAARPTISGRFR